MPSPEVKAAHHLCDISTWRRCRLHCSFLTAEFCSVKSLHCQKMFENIGSQREKHWKIVLKNIRSSNKIKQSPRTRRTKVRRILSTEALRNASPCQSFRLWRSLRRSTYSLSCRCHLICFNWYRKNLSISTPLSPAGLPHVAGYQGNKDSAVCFYGEQTQTSRLPTLRSLIHVERLRISDSSTEPSISSLSAVFFIPVQSIGRMTWEVNNSDGWVPIAALWWQGTTNPTPEKSRSSPMKLSARIQS